MHCPWDDAFVSSFVLTHRTLWVQFDLDWCKGSSMPRLRFL